MKHSLLYLLLSTAVLIPAAQAGDQTATQKEIAALGEAFVTAFNKGDVKTLAAAWLPDGDYVDQSGQRFRGREEIENLYTAFFAENPGAKLRIDSESLRLVSDQLAIEDGTSAVILPGGGAPSRARYANTFAKVNGKWLLASTRESAFPAPDRSQELAPLGWMIGDWEAKTKDGEVIFLSVRPSPDGNFLITQRTVIVSGKPVSGGTEWIAWDPAQKQIRSWSFEGDGGFGESEWVRGKDGWTVNSRFTLRSGATLEDTQTLTKSPEGLLTVKTQAKAGGKALPDIADVQFQRSNPR